MIITKRHKPIPNHKVTHDTPANSPVTTYHMDPAEMIAKYGPPIRSWKKGWRG